MNLDNVRIVVIGQKGEFAQVTLLVELIREMLDAHAAPGLDVMTHQIVANGYDTDVALSGSVFVSGTYKTDVVYKELIKHIDNTASILREKLTKNIIKQRK